MRTLSPSRLARQIMADGEGWFLVTVLSLLAIASFIDRQVLNLLVDPIKADLGLTDVQMSILQGFSLALLQTVLAMPVAWISDRYNRKWVIIIGLLFWTGATFLTGLAMAFGVLFIARMGEGIGEATLAPAGVSMISDRFEAERLPAAISVYTGAGFVGSGLALVVGGFFYTKLDAIGPLALPFGTFAPWQLTFMVLSLMSIPLGLLLLFVREPKRRDGDVVLTGEDSPPALEIIAFLRQHARMFFPLFLGLSGFAAAQFGIGSWAPSYFIRVHHWSQMEVGAYYGPVVIAAGLGGVVCAGFLAQYQLARGVVDATLRIPIIAIAIALPMAIAFPLVHSPFLALALLTGVQFFGTFPFGAGVATFPLVTPNRMRAQVMAFYLLTANLIGYSAGPVLVAEVTDGVFGNAAKVNYSLAIVPPAIMAIGMLFVWLAIKPYRSMQAEMKILES